MIDAGNTVVAIEHNKRFLSAADHVITMGPGAGENGGFVMPVTVRLNHATAPEKFERRFT